MADWNIDVWEIQDDGVPKWHWIASCADKKISWQGLMAKLEGETQAQIMAWVVSEADEMAERAGESEVGVRSVSGLLTTRQTDSAEGGVEFVVTSGAPGENLTQVEWTVPVETVATVAQTPGEYLVSVGRESKIAELAETVFTEQTMGPVRYLPEPDTVDDRDVITFDMQKESEDGDAGQ